jgi:hypothetical protein
VERRGALPCNVRRTLELHVADHSSPL